MFVKSRHLSSSVTSIRLNIFLRINYKKINSLVAKEADETNETELDKAYDTHKSICAFVAKHFNEINPVDSKVFMDRFGIHEDICRYDDFPDGIFRFVIDGNCYDLTEEAIVKIQKSFMALIEMQSLNVPIEFDHMTVERQIATSESVSYQ